MKISFDPLAKREYEEAFEYYEAQEDGLGEKFRRGGWEAVTILERFAAIGEEVRSGIRKILLRRFPYKLIYSVFDDSIYIIAVAHGYRKPEYWLGQD